MPISAEGRAAFAVIHGFGDDVELAGHFVNDFRGGDAGLIGRFHRTVRKVADRNRIVSHCVGQVFCHPPVEEINAARAHRAHKPKLRG
ncbi:MULTISPECIES: hypothetical protein [unclassified Mesorhizobium]|uniref:hypothetical protein n=1 Tax=unclassified Mesorhizobium TaxID=325217 RepID=UPI001CD143D8|nr:MULTISPECIES: hypothetical protein [unclassified Mesorhizobium]MBZ9889036.1 hypothetical protein [Mesorhizobium sp. BR1-1-3]